MPQERAPRIDNEARDAGTASAREALEHPHILFRFQRDPLDAAMHTAFEQEPGKSQTRPPKRRAGK